MSISAIKDAFTIYSDELPNEILPTISKSFLYTFAVALLFSTRAANGSYDMSAPFIKASVAALASTIHALATPMFNRTFGTAALSPWYEFVKSTITAFAASAVVGFSLNSTLQLTSFKLYYLISSNSYMAWMTNVKNSPHIKENSIYFCF